MTSNLMLADEDCLRSMVHARSQMAQARLTTLPPSQGMDWFDAIKLEAESGSFERRGSVAMVKICGALDYHYSFWSWLFDSSCYIGIINSVNAAMNDSSIKKIVLLVDSPGGGFHGNVECSNAIYAARGVKEVVAVVDPCAASAGYWLASQAERIVCIESGWVGSIGSQMPLMSMYRYYQEEGVDYELIRAKISPDKNLGAVMDPISDRAREDRQRLTDYAGDLFLTHIERGRGRSRKEILDNYGKGVMYFGPEAIDRGMVDSIGSLQSELDVEVAEKPKPQNMRSVRSEVVSLGHLLD